MKSTRFYKLIILLLVVINIGTLLFVWLNRPPHPPGPGDTPHLADQIGLTGENKVAIDILEKEHHKDKQVLMKRDFELHKEMFDLVGSDQNSDSIIALLNENKETIEQMTFDFFDEIANHCNDQQLEKLKDFIQHRMIEMRPPGPPQ